MIDRLESTEELEQLASPWNELLKASRSDCLFLTWEWLFTWWKHLSANRRLFLLRVSSGSDLVALAPLARTAAGPARFFRCKSLDFLGTGSVGSDYLDFVIRRDREAEALPAMADYLVRQNALLNLSQLNRKSAAAKGLGALWKHRGGQLCEARTNVCPVIRLAGHTWDSYLSTLGSEHRYNFRRRLKQLTSRFDVRFEQVRCEGQRREALARLIALHNLRRNSRGGSNAFHTPALLAFHDEITQLALQRGWLRLFTLWLGDTPVAALYGFLYNNVFYFYQTGFDPRYSGSSVGLVTMGLAIKSAIEEGAEEYDLLHGAERYKFHWANDIRELGRLELYPRGLRGMAWKTSRELNRGLRRLARRMLSPAEEEGSATATMTGGSAAYAAGRG